MISSIISNLNFIPYTFPVSEIRTIVGKPWALSKPRQTTESKIIKTENSFRTNLLSSCWLFDKKGNNLQLLLSRKQFLGPGFKFLQYTWIQFLYHNPTITNDLWTEYSSNIHTTAQESGAVNWKSRNLYNTQYYYHWWWWHWRRRQRRRWHHTRLLEFIAH